MTIEIPAAEIHRQKTDDLRGLIERRADICVNILLPLIELATVRKLTAREADAADEAVNGLKHPLDDLWAHRATRSA